MGVVSGERAGGEAGPGDLDLEGVVLVWLLGGWNLDGDGVVGFEVADAVIEGVGDHIVADDDAATGMRGKDLEGQIAEVGLRGSRKTFDEGFVEGGAHASGIGGAERIDAVEGDAGLMQERGEVDDGVEDVLLLGGADGGAGSAEQRPAGADPDDHFLAGATLFLGGEGEQSVEREAETNFVSLKALAGADVSEGVHALLDGGGQGVSVC